VQRLETERDQERGRDGDRRAEAGRSLDEGSEAEGDQERLDPPIGRERSDLLLDDLEPGRVDRDVEDEDRVEHDPADRQQSEGDSVTGSGRRQGGGHAIHGDGNQESCHQSAQSGHVRAGVKEPEQTQQHDDRHRGHKGGREDVAKRIVFVKPRHRAHSKRFRVKAGGRERRLSTARRNLRSSPPLCPGGPDFLPTTRYTGRDSTPRTAGTRNLMDCE
jgi:hypothetical protein